MAELLLPGAPTRVYLGENTVLARAMVRLAEAQAGAAEGFANKAAVSSATAESAAGPTYPDTATGLAATTDGQAFAVDNGDGTVTVWLNDGGVAVNQRKLATTDYLASSNGAAGVGVGKGGSIQDWVDRRIPAITDIDPTITANGTGDQSAKLNAVLDGTYPEVYIPRGIYKINSQVTVHRSVSIYADLGAKIDASGATGGFPDQAAVYVAGDDPTPIANLASGTHSRGAMTLMFAAAHGLAAGDLILILNPTDGSYNAARPAYRDGEYCEVASVASSTSVTLSKPLIGTYSAAAVNVYKVAAPSTGNFGPFEVIAPGEGSNANVIGFFIRHGRNNHFDRTKASGSGHCSFMIQNCYKPNGEIVGDQWFNGPSGTSYGVCIGSSYVEDIRGRFRGWRHGIAQGSDGQWAVPTRARVHSFVAENHPSSSALAAADWHGDSEDCIYENGVCINGGLNAAGDRNIARNIVVNGGSEAIGILGSELKGWTHTYENVVLRTQVNDVNRGALLDVGGNSTSASANTTRGGVLTVRRCRVEAANHTGAIATVRNRGSSVDCTVIVDDIEASAPSINRAVFVSAVSGAAPQNVQVTNIKGIGNKAPLVIGTSEASRPTLIRQDSQSGVTVLASDTGMGRVVSGYIDFPRPFAKTPKIFAQEPTQSTNGVDRVAAGVFAVEASRYRLQVSRMDGGNFAAAVNLNVTWDARLWEW